MKPLVRRIQARLRGLELRLQSRRAGTEPTFPSLVSQLCTVSQMQTDTYREWCEAMGYPEVARRGPPQHRKAWEYAFIAQALAEQLGLGSGVSGLGFGVGRERLVPLFAKLGCDVLATDVGLETAVERGWAQSRQHADATDGLARLNVFDICPAERFSERVRYREVDMNRIPEDLKGFDFCWSACAFEHLGSIEAGLRFVVAAMACLRPGGVAVHTTEYNLASDDRTVDHEGTVLFRRRDLRRLVDELEDHGHAVSPLNLHPGRQPPDHHVDLPPYDRRPHLRLLIESFAATSVGIIIRKVD